MPHSDAVLRDAIRELAASPSPAVDARILLAHVLDVSLGRLVLVDEVSDVQAARYAALVARRATGEPVQHITGVAHFRRISVKVGPGVFVPRPESEVMVGWALEQLRGIAEPIVVELCAGSGALSLAFADEFPAASIWAVEKDADALRFAEANLAGTSVRLVAADMEYALRELDGQADLVIANPPYIPAASDLPWDVVGFDPEVALFSGADGLDATRVVARVAARLLRPGGMVASEHDDSHEHLAPAVFAADGRFIYIADHRDLTGRPRFVTARRRPTASLRVLRNAAMIARR